LNSHDNPDGTEPRRHHPEDLSDRSEDSRPHRGRRRGNGRGRSGRGRMARGDVRTAILLLLADQPMHGYQLMEAVADRTEGRWTPSPGAIYPAINQLEDEGLVTVTAQSGRKVATLTDAGREHIRANRDSWPEPYGGVTDARPGHDLRGLLAQLHDATRQIGRTGTDAQIDATAKTLTDARRAIYLLLADGPEATND
jgi:DNA-binding PadR family transcriptional regulator